VISLELLLNIWYGKNVENAKTVLFYHLHISHASLDRTVVLRKKQSLMEWCRQRSASRWRKYTQLKTIPVKSNYPVAEIQSKKHLQRWPQKCGSRFGGEHFEATVRWTFLQWAVVCRNEYECNCQNNSAQFISFCWSLYPAHHYLRLRW